MIGAVVPVALFLADAADPMRAAVAHYEEVAAYEVTIRSSSDGQLQTLHYYFQKPGYVRMEFVSPHKGAVLVYSPATQRAKVWPFGYRRFPSLMLSPTNRLIQGSGGQRVDRSDVGALYQTITGLQQHGKTTLSGTDTVGQRAALKLEVEGENGFSANGIARFQLWLDLSTGFPLKVKSYDAAGRLIEAVDMDDLKINPDFPGGFFDQ